MLEHSFVIVKSVQCYSGLNSFPPLDHGEARGRTGFPENRPEPTLKIISFSPPTSRRTKDLKRSSFVALTPLFML